MPTTEQFIRIFLPLAIFFLCAKLSQTRYVKGKIGEWGYALMLRFWLDRKVYHILNDITLRLPDGSTTQIDHIVVSRYGIFVIEVKNYQGWIFGDVHGKVWTQVLNKHSKFKFQNPIRQNHRHVMALAELTGIPLEYFKPVVAFVGGCALKTPLPPNAGYTGKMARYIANQRPDIIRDEQVPEIVTVIQEWRKASGSISNREHVENLKSRHKGTKNATLIAELPDWMQKGDDHNEEPGENVADRKDIQQCPRCHRPLVIRISRKGTTIGKQFLGCSGYPACRHTEQIT